MQSNMLGVGLYGGKFSLPDVANMVDAEVTGGRFQSRISEPLFSLPDVQGATNYDSSFGRQMDEWQHLGCTVF